VKGQGTGELRDKRPHEPKSERNSRKRYLRLAFVFSCVSCSFLFFWRRLAALGLVDGDPSTGMWGSEYSKQPVADGLSHETLDSKCWFLTVLLLSKHETGNAGSSRFFCCRNTKCWSPSNSCGFSLTFYGALLLFSVWFTCVRYSLATKTPIPAVVLVGPQPQTPALRTVCVANKRLCPLECQ